MNERIREARRDPSAVLTPDEARQGEIILRTRRRRIVFIAGLVGLAILALLFGVA